MNRISEAALRRVIGAIVEQSGPREALIRFVFYTEEFVERFDVEAVLAHLEEEERRAMKQHFADETSHARALRAYCVKNGLPIARSPGEESLVRRSDEGYAQYLRHLDPETNRFTVEEMYSYYSHVELQEELADSLYRIIADQLEQRGLHLRFVRILRAFAASEREHQGYAHRFMAKYRSELSPLRAGALRLRTRWLSISSGALFFRDFLRLLVDEHGFDARGLGWMV